MILHYFLYRCNGRICELLILFALFMQDFLAVRKYEKLELAILIIKMSELDLQIYKFQYCGYRVVRNMDYTL